MAGSKKLRPAWEIRAELIEAGEEHSFEPEEMGTIAKEAEAVYNYLVLQGKPPSELFERLILVLQREHKVFSHPDRDHEAECPGCDRR